MRRSAAISPVLSVALAGLAICAAARAQEQDLRDLVEQALDQNITRHIEISDAPLPDALRRLERETGLRFAVSKVLLASMPYGEQTHVNIDLENVSVRKGLGRVFAGLGGTMHVEGDHVLVEPAPVLERLGRKLTIEEAELLQKLASYSWQTIAAEGTHVEFQVDAAQDAARAWGEALAHADAEIATAQLEEAAHATGLVWTLDGARIVVYPRIADIANRLDRPIPANYQRTPLDELLLDLGRRINVLIQFEPGALLRVNAAQRNVDLIQRQTTARQVLERICGSTGLAYRVTDDGVLIFTPRPATTAAGAGSAAPAASAGRVIAIIEVPVGTDGTKVQFLLREDDLPPELRRLRERKMPEIIEELRKQEKE